MSQSSNRLTHEEIAVILQNLPLTELQSQSRFPWLLSDYEFVRTPNTKWIFAFIRIKDTLLIALEPITPNGSFSNFTYAWTEFIELCPANHFIFVRVNGGFRGVLQKLGFQSIKIGHEPWLTLNDYSPSGNTSKGVRSAHNQALRRGMQVEQWEGTSVAQNPSQQKIIQGLFQEFKQRHWLHVFGFLNAQDPLAHMEMRIYFVAFSNSGIPQGYLCCTAIQHEQRYAVEDVILGSKAYSGAAELLTLTALQSLEQRKIQEVSLGLLPATFLDPKNNSNLVKPFAWLVPIIPRIVSFLYPLQGLKTFRKRFNPNHYEATYVCLKSKSLPISNLAWIKAALKLLQSFKPTLNLNVESVMNPIKLSLKKHPVSWFYLFNVTTIFGFINHFGNLPEWALNRFAFYADVPIWQWPLRSISSDLLYFDLSHFLIVVSLYFFTLRWLEKTQPLRFVVPFVFFSHLFDDFINYFLILKPFHFIEASLYEHFITYKDVGSSLCLMVIIGFQINVRARRHREFIFVIMVLGVLLASLFTTLKFTALVLNINHLIFMLFGYITGKIQFEMMRAKNRKKSLLL